MTAPSRATRLWLCATAACVALGLLTVAVLSGGVVVTADRRIELQVLIHQHGGVRHVAAALSWIGAPVTVGVVVALAAIALAVRRDLVRAITLPVGSLAVLVLGQLARHAIGRSAPTDGSHLHVPGGDGYPSGHALGAALCLGAIAVVVRRTWVAVTAVVLMLLTAAGRVYEFAHFPSDVLASLLAAAVVIAVVEASAETLSTRRRAG
jgi:undecaprenyl-diphosphatase